jgi:hypothetical protein
MREAGHGAGSTFRSIAAYIPAKSMESVVAQWFMGLASRWGTVYTPAVGAGRRGGWNRH